MTPAVEHWTSRTARENFEMTARKDGRDKVLDKLTQWAWDNRSLFFFNNAYNPLLEKIKELRQEEK